MGIDFPFDICSSICHLGIYLLTNFSIEINYEQTNTYSLKYLLWLGRINAIKQDILLRFLHIFQTLPIVANQTFPHAIQASALGPCHEGIHPRIATVIESEPSPHPYKGRYTGTQNHGPLTLGYTFT